MTMAGAEDRAELDRLLDELDAAGCFAEGLAETADLVCGQVVDIVVKPHGMKFQDGECLEWALEEMKCAVTRIRDASESLADHLKAGEFRPAAHGAEAAP